MGEFSTIMMLIGEAVLVCSICYCIRIEKRTKALLKEGGTSVCVMDAYLALIVFFSIGYIVMLFMLKDAKAQTKILVGLILLFGSFFVLFSLLMLQFFFRLLTTIRLNQTDPATGLLNKTAGMNYIRSKLAKDTGEWALYMIDLNSFKQINDTYGHMAGDCVICAAATSLRNSVDGEDMVSRFGGDEFVVFTRFTSAQEMQTKRARIHASILQLKCEACHQEIVLTSSVGEVCGRYPITAEELLEQADLEMYKAKRNRS